MKTIRQLADELGISKQALQKRLSRDPLKTRMQGHISEIDGTKQIDETGEKLIKEGMDKPVDKPMDAPIDKGMDRVDTLLALVFEQQQTIKDLTAANRELTAALENTTSSLHAAQALHAGTMQKALTDGSPAPEEKPRRWWPFGRKEDK